MLPSATPSTRVTRLFSVEELTSLVIRSQKADEAQLQLLRVEPSVETTGRAPKGQSHIRFAVSVFFLFFLVTDNFTYVPFCVVSRQKRREAKAKKAKVTFRPNESIIPPQEVERYYF